MNKRANWPIGILELSCQFLFFPAIRHTIVVHRMMNVEIKSFPKDSYTHWAWFAKLYCAWCLFTVFILIPLTRCSYFLMYFVVCVSFILILSFLFFFFSLSYFPPLPLLLTPFLIFLVFSLHFTLFFVLLHLLLCHLLFLYI